MSEAETPDTTSTPAAPAMPYVTPERLQDTANAFIDALGDLDGLIDLLDLLEKAAERPDLPNIALRPVLASLRRIAGHVNAGLDLLDTMNTGIGA